MKAKHLAEILMRDPEANILIATHSNYNDTYYESGILLDPIDHNYADSLGVDYHSNLLSGYDGHYTIAEFTEKFGENYPSPD